HRHWDEPFAVLHQLSHKNLPFEPEVLLIIVMPPARPRNGKEAGKSKWLCVRALPATSDGKICRIARALCEPVHTRSREKFAHRRRRRRCDQGLRVHDARLSDVALVSQTRCVAWAASAALTH